MHSEKGIRRGRCLVGISNLRRPNSVDWCTGHGTVSEEAFFYQMLKDLHQCAVPKILKLKATDVISASNLSLCFPELCASGFLHFRR